MHKSKEQERERGRRGERERERRLSIRCVILSLSHSTDCSLLVIRACAFRFYTSVLILIQGKGKMV